MTLKKARKKILPGLSACIEIFWLVRVYGNLFTILAHALKFNNAFDQSKQGIVPATTNIVTGMDLRTTLTIDDITGFYDFTAEFFTSEPLTI